MHAYLNKHIPKSLVLDVIPNPPIWTGLDCKSLQFDPVLMVGFEILRKIFKSFSCHVISMCKILLRLSE